MQHLALVQVQVKSKEQIVLDIQIQTLHLKNKWIHLLLVVTHYLVLAAQIHAVNVLAGIVFLVFKG